MREIKFRGKTKKDEWIYGDFIHSRIATDVWISSRNATCGAIEFIQPRSVVPETVGQYTGLKDKNGVEIYEGDVVRHGYENHNGTFFSNYPVRYSENDGAYMVGQHKRLTKNTIKQWSSEVIGNIHDNPELAEGIEL